MSETTQHLTDEQAADLRRQLRERELRGLECLVYGTPLPPLPSCPACGVAPNRVEERVEDSQFGVFETARLVCWSPCGHRFRYVFGPNTSPASPDEERVVFSLGGVEVSPEVEERYFSEFINRINQPHCKPTT
ncbi:hypothetical protein [Streptomyces murinus]|uniref:hypothetical protein n=1 Tax=Streptomyces murinus TaxID=33900 RepID=UPI0018F2E906|nr:hypothetical protein [Streptomyces murinus]